MWASYHNHTTYSDGKGTIAEMVDAAKRAGLVEVGLSDHLTLHPAGRAVSWSMNVSDVSNYCDAVRDAAGAAANGLPVRLGLELDWFAGHERVLREATRAHSFDYIIGSVHFVGDFPIDGHPERWHTLTQPEVDEMHRGYWIEMARMASSGVCDIVAHIDLPKKFGYLPAIAPTREIDKALDAIAQADLVVELNTAGWHKVCADAYPSLAILRACRERGICVMLSADAHRPEDIARDFDRGAARLREAGYDRVARFRARERHEAPLTMMGA